MVKGGIEAVVLARKDRNDMLSVMPRAPKRKDKQPEYPAFVDVFSRMSGEQVQKLDALADDQHRSRSAMVAWIVDQFIEAEHPKLLAKRKAASN